MKKEYKIFIIILSLACVGALVFYFLSFSKNKTTINPPIDNFVQSIGQSPVVVGNVINSGIMGTVVLANGKPFEASLDVFLADDLSRPYISIRTHSDGTFQIPLKLGSYVLKPMDPDGPIAPVRKSYDFVVNSGQWLQVKIEYK